MRILIFALVFLVVLYGLYVLLLTFLSLLAHRLVRRKKASRRQIITVIIVQATVLILTYVVIALVWGLASSDPHEAPSSTLEQISVVPIFLFYISACVGIGYGTAWLTRGKQT